MFEHFWVSFGSEFDCLSVTSAALAWKCGTAHELLLIDCYSPGSIVDCLKSMIP